MDFILIHGDLPRHMGTMFLGVEGMVVDTKLNLMSFRKKGMLVRNNILETMFRRIQKTIKILVMKVF
jgi:hypothetical protein